MKMLFTPHPSKSDFAEPVSPHEVLSGPFPIPIAKAQEAGGQARTSNATLVNTR